MTGRTGDYLRLSNSQQSFNVMNQTMGNVQWAWGGDNKSLSVIQCSICLLWIWMETEGGTWGKTQSVGVSPTEKSVGTISLHMGFDSRRKTEIWDLAGRTNRGKEMCLRNGPWLPPYLYAGNEGAEKVPAEKWVTALNNAGKEVSWRSSVKCCSWVILTQ